MGLDFFCTFQINAYLMRRIDCLLLLLILFMGSIHAQPPTVPLGISARDKFSQGITTDWSDQLFISDVNGMPIKRKYIDVSGSPYFTEVFKYAVVTLSNGRAYANVRIRIDLADQEACFLSSKGEEGIMGPGTVKQVSYADTVAGGIIFYTFQTGFPAVDRQGSKNFYQVLAEGKCSFIKSISKSISERKNELSGEISKEFESFENYYLFIKGEMKRLKKDKDFFNGELSDKQAEISLFIQSNKLNLKNNDHIVKLVNYYNSL